MNNKNGPSMQSSEVGSWLWEGYKHTPYSVCGLKPSAAWDLLPAGSTQAHGSILLDTTHPCTNTVSELREGRPSHGDIMHVLGETHRRPVLQQPTGNPCNTEVERQLGETRPSESKQ